MKQSLPHRSIERPLPYLPSEIPLRSDWIGFVNPAGKRIAAYYDHLTASTPSKGFIIIVAGYGKTKTAHLPLAYYLALNGFEVLRYDHTQHVGESEGGMRFTTLTQMRADLHAAIDFVEREFSPSRLALVSSSLGVRVALRQASEDRRVKLLISLIGVFNLQGTLSAIYCEDGVKKVLDGTSVGVRDILGFQIDADHFLRDAIQGNFHTLQTSLGDAGRVQTPCVLFAAEKDPWVSLNEVRLVYDEIPTHLKEIHLLPNAMHELYENPAAAESACREIVACAEKYLVGTKPQWYEVRTPGKGLIRRRLQQEKEKLRSGRGLNLGEEQGFWKKYLEKYVYIVNLQDYWNLLDFLNRLLGDWTRGGKILDAGCGIGNLGTFILVRQLYHVMQGQAMVLPGRPLVRYFGVDFVEEAIQRAATKHTEVQEEFKRKMGFGQDGPDVVRYSYSVLDLNRPLPFASHSFDKICCNLVLSYVSDPLCATKELFRTLKIGGRIVITSLKPYADLSQIYRDFIQVSRTSEELEQARVVLNNAGMIKHKEAEGYYQFFSEAELHDLLAEAGAKNIQTSRSFGDQANVAVADRSP